MTKIVVIILLLCFPVTVFSDDGDWKTYTNVNPIRSFVCVDTTLWCASSGGVLKVDITSQETEIFTNTEGLSSNSVTAVTRDADANIWIGTESGDLNVFSAESGVWELIHDYSGHQIYDLQIVGDSLYVACDFGVSLYQISAREVREHYKKLGNLLAWNTRAKAIAIKDRDIWVATDQGVAKSNLDYPNLMDPQFWTNYTTTDGLLSNEITTFAAFQNNIYAGTSLGLSKWDGNTWLDAGFGSTSISALFSTSDSLVAGAGISLKIYNGVSWHTLPSSPQKISDVLIDGYGDFWIGTESDGLYRFDSNLQTWENIRANSPMSDAFTAMALDKNGALWCIAADKGVSSFKNGEWRCYDDDDGITYAPYRTIGVDSYNRKWCGSAGKGIAVIEDVEDTLYVFYVDTTGGALVGAQGESSVHPNYVVIEDLTVDANGNVWISNKFALTRQPLVVVTPDYEFQYFSLADGIRETKISCLAVDDTRGWVWIGMENLGISVIDFAGTPLDKSDDQYVGSLTTVDGLNGDEIRSIAIDDDGVVWIGTDKGLNYWFDGRVDSRGGLLSDDINIIAIDFRNNKWIGTFAGVSMLSADSYTWTHYSTDDYPLVGSNVRSFAFDPNTGYVYIGTESGLSRLATPFTPPKEDLSEVEAYPNPFIIDTGPVTKFTIRNLADRSSVSIFTPNGLLIRTIGQDQIPGSWAEWDGRNQQGDLVASGVYIYVIYTEDEQSHVGKVAVVRN